MSALLHMPLSEVQVKVSGMFNSQVEQVRLVSRVKHVISDMQKPNIIFTLVYHRQNFGEYGLFLFTETDQLQLFESLPLNLYFNVKIEDYGKGRFSVKYNESGKNKTYIFESNTDSMCSILFIIRKALHSIGRPYIPLEKIFSRLNDSWEDNKKILPPFQWITYLNERYDLDQQEITFLNPLYQSFLGGEEVVTTIKIIERSKSIKSVAPVEPPKSSGRTKEEEEDIVLSDDEDKEKILLSSDEEDVKDYADDEWN
jgi:muconolactone delta-isomerase